jgi:hypothetical protein
MTAVTVEDPSHLAFAARVERLPCLDMIHVYMTPGRRGRFIRFDDQEPPKPFMLVETFPGRPSWTRLNERFTEILNVVGIGTPREPHSNEMSVNGGSGWESKALRRLGPRRMGWTEWTSQRLTSPDPWMEWTQRIQKRDSRGTVSRNFNSGVPPRRGLRGHRGALSRAFEGAGDHVTRGSERLGRGASSLGRLRPAQPPRVGKAVRPSG